MNLWAPYRKCSHYTGVSSALPQQRARQGRGARAICARRVRRGQNRSVGEAAERGRVVNQRVVFCKALDEQSRVKKAREFHVILHAESRPETMGAEGMPRIISRHASRSRAVHPPNNPHKNP
jgi:hypothetical protein